MADNTKTMLPPALEEDTSPLPMDEEDMRLAHGCDYCYDFQVQTRSAEGGLQHWKRLEDAMTEAARNPSIWKISFFLPNGESCRLIRKNPGWFAYWFLNANPQWIYQPLVLYKE